MPGVVALDIEVTPELEVEGRARDLVRLIQQARRDAGLDVSDRIVLTVVAAEPWLDAVGRARSVDRERDVGDECRDRTFRQ